MRKTLRIMAIVGAFVLIGAIAAVAFAANRGSVTKPNDGVSAPVTVTSSSDELTLAPSDGPKAESTRDGPTAHDHADNSVNSSADSVDDSPDATEAPDVEDDQSQAANAHGGDEQGSDDSSDDSRESGPDSRDGQDQSDD